MNNCLTCTIIEERKRIEYVIELHFVILKRRLLSFVKIQ